MELTEMNRADLDAMASRIAGPAADLLASTTVSLLESLARFEVVNALQGPLDPGDPEHRSFIQRHAGYVMERAAGLLSGPLP